MHNVPNNSNLSSTKHRQKLVNES